MKNSELQLMLQLQRIWLDYLRKRTNRERLFYAHIFMPLFGWKWMD